MSVTGQGGGPGKRIFREHSCWNGAEAPVLRWHLCLKAVKEGFRDRGTTSPFLGSDCLNPGKGTLWLTKTCLFRGVA
ncbi:hypothetical protein BN1012_Phect742 [Candidatus Phaeomarinobacter ectocarpi]|uniref:Uncharacterized protein n=1 Tax=Candidatus Phaeomarinibacter ectocarpi TaxID=1458461 RepID=X5MM50_9HYPH|nr:hypothetical protein BN1012_Phect742 [Candidatus Phaeomarinobacter ectocarpi]